MPKFILKISSLEQQNYINIKDVDCFIFSTQLPENYLITQINKVKEIGKISLLEGDNAADFVVKFDADGIIIDLTQCSNIKKEINHYKKQIGSRFLGVICRNRRHEAMIVSENEPDFIIFRLGKDENNKTKELTSWYEEFFLLQMAIEIMDDDIDFLSYQTDIIILTPERFKILVAQKQRLE